MYFSHKSNSLSANMLSRQTPCVYFSLLLAGLHLEAVRKAFPEIS